MEKIGTDAYCFDTNGHTALLSNNRLLLADTGTEPNADTIIAGIEKAGYEATDLDHILITHTHPDHVGGLATLQDLTGAEVAAHKIEAKYISKEELYQGPPGPDSQKHPGTEVNVLLDDGDEYQGLMVIYTPGHTEGHISVLDTEQSLLLAGDALRNDPDGLAPMPNKFNLDPDQHRESIKKLANYQFEKIIFGHGDPIRKEGDKLVKKFAKSL